MSDMSEDMKAEPEGAEKEQKPFFRTPMGIIVIILLALVLCCCTALLIVGLSADSIVDWAGEVIDDPEFQRQMEEFQLTIEAGG